MIRLPIKFEVHLRPLRRYENGYKMWKLGWFWVVKGHLRSLIIAPFDTAYIRVPISLRTDGQTDGHTQ